MKKIFLLLGIIFLAAAAFGQTSNTLYARDFPGSTIGAKVTAAQDACNANTALECVIVIDSGLAAYPTGTMPAPCANCVWWDLRKGTQFPGLELTTTGTSGAATLKQGVLNIPDYAGSGATSPLSLNPPGTTYLLGVDSAIGDDINALSPGPQTITAGTCTVASGTCTWTFASTADFQAGSWLQFVNEGIDPTNCAAKTAEDIGLGWPNGCWVSKILTTGFTSTTLETHFHGTADESCSSTTTPCGSADAIQGFLGPVLQNEPFIAGHGTVEWQSCANASGGNTLAFTAANFASCYQAFPDGTATAPVKYVIAAWSDDIAAGETAPEIEGYATTVLEDCHAKNWQCYMATSPPLKNTLTAVRVNSWIRGLDETPANAVTGAYVDGQLDVGTKFSPFVDFWAGNGSLEPAGVSRMDSFIAQVVGLGVQIQTANSLGMINSGDYAVDFYPYTGTGGWYGFNFYDKTGQNDVDIEDQRGDPLSVNAATETGTQNSIAAFYSGTAAGNSDANFINIGNAANQSEFGSIDSPSEAFMKAPGGTAQWNVLGTGEVNDSFYDNATCLSVDASGNVTAGCPTITTTIEHLNITSGICTTTGAETLCSMSETWPTAFANNSYSAGCSYASLPTGTGTNPGMYGPYISAKTTTGFTLTIQAGSNSAGGNNTVPEIDCWGMD